MYRFGFAIVLATIWLAGGGAHALAGGCHEYGAPDWRAPVRTGQLSRAWPLRKSDREGWRTRQAKVLRGKRGLELEVLYPRGSINPGNRSAPDGGLGFWDRIYAGDRQAGCLSYQVKLQHGFRFAKGGKLPGLWGGGAVGGCARRRDLGFSTRYMWNRNGEGYVYSYFADRTTRCGKAIYPPRPKKIYLKPGHWQQLDQLVVLNTPGKSDGVLKVWFDGELVISRKNVRYRDKASVRIDGLMFSTFFGGNSRGNASPRNQKSWFRRFEYRALSSREARLAR